MAAKTLIIPIAGAGNCGRDVVSTAAPHFYRMLGKLKRIDGAQVANPLVPAGFGILGSLDKTYDQVRTSIEKIQQKQPDAKKIIVGHSLGGLLGRKLLAEGLADGVVGIGSPQRGLRRIVPAPTRAAYIEFSEAIPDTADIGQIALIGYRHDELVPLESSLAELQNAERHEYMSKTTHNLLLLSSGVINLSAELVSSMVERTIQEPVIPALAYLPRPA
jgi:hypothetical protein